MSETHTYSLRATRETIAHVLTVHRFNYDILAPQVAIFHNGDLDFREIQRFQRSANVGTASGIRVASDDKYERMSIVGRHLHKALTLSLDETFPCLTKMMIGGQDVKTRKPVIALLDDTMCVMHQQAGVIQPLLFDYWRRQEKSTALDVSRHSVGDIFSTFAENYNDWLQSERDREYRESKAFEQAQAQLQLERAANDSWGSW